MDGVPEEVRAVGVVGPDAEALAEAVTAAGGTPTVGDAPSVLAADVDAVLAHGEAALLSLVRAEADVPLLPVAAGAGVRAVPRDAVAPALAALRDGDWTVETHPRLAVSVDDRFVARGLFDVTLVTTEPAHISEFGVATPAEPVSRFRADGVVAATPAGSPGYAQAAGGPVVPPGPGLLVVVPIAPFATSLEDWVLPADGLTLTVEREEAKVDLQVDDRTVGTVDVDETVTIDATDTVDVLRVPQGRSPFARGEGELEKL